MVCVLLHMYLYACMYVYVHNTIIKDKIPHSYVAKSRLMVVSHKDKEETGRKLVPFPDEPVLIRSRNTVW